MAENKSRNLKYLWVQEQRGRTDITAHYWTLTQSTQLETAVCFGAPLRTGVDLGFI